MLREATDDDVLAIREWRNHDKVREVSQTTDVIPLETHLQWWAAVQGDPTRRVLIYEHDGVPSGVVNFSQITTDPDGTPSAEWGFFLDTDGVEERGDTLRVWMGLEKEAIDYAFDVLKLGVLRGETLGWNTAVRQLHKRFGMSEPGKIYRLIGGEMTEVVFNELRAEDRRHR